MKALVYESTKSKTLSTEEYKHMVAKAAENNSLHEVTGFICELEENYLQYLEGSSEDIEKIMSLIRSDERHFNIKEFKFDIDNRLFKTWSMVAIPPHMVGSVHFGHLMQSTLNLMVGKNFSKAEVKNRILSIAQKWTRAHLA